MGALLETKIGVGSQGTPNGKWIALTKLEWYIAPCLLLAAWTVMGSSPELPPMQTDTPAGMWIKKVRLPC